MAATVSDLQWVSASNSQGPYVLEAKLSSMTSGELVSIDFSSHGVSGVEPEQVELASVPTRASSGSGVMVQKESADTSADTVSVRVVAADGGSLSGAVVKVHLKFRAAASGGLVTA